MEKPAALAGHILLGHTFLLAGLNKRRKTVNGTDCANP